MNDHNQGLRPRLAAAGLPGRHQRQAGRSQRPFSGPVPRSGNRRSRTLQLLLLETQSAPRHLVAELATASTGFKAVVYLALPPIDLNDLPPETMDLETFADYADKSPAETLAILKKTQSKGSSGQMETHL